MRSWSAGLLVVTVLALGVPAHAARPPKEATGKTLAGIAVAQIVYVDGLVERQAFGETSWQQVKAGTPMRTGDRLRTATDGTVRISFPWMSLTASPGTTVLIPATVVLATVLDEGRVEVNAHGGDIVKLKTTEAEIRGQGRVVVRRRGDDHAVLVMAREGRFRAEAEGQTVSFVAGQGTVIHAGEPPKAAETLPAVPVDESPGTDPLYVRQGDPVKLSWSSAEIAHTVEILPLDSNDVALAREAGKSPLEVEIPWLGLWRWRVAARNPEGLEGPASAEGLVCVVDR